jgi:hypothetical protein
MGNSEIKDIVEETVRLTLLELGISKDDHHELKADFAHLRRWRKSVEQAQNYSIKVVITTIVGGLLGALWMGIKAMLGK